MTRLGVASGTAIDVLPQRIATHLAVLHAVDNVPFVIIVYALMVLEEACSHLVGISFTVTIHDFLSAVEEACFVELRARAILPWLPAYVAEFGFAETAVCSLSWYRSVVREG